MMKGKVKSINYGITHRIAYCLECNWSHEDYLDKGLCRKIVAHVRKNPHHRIVVETGSARHYCFESEE